MTAARPILALGSWGPDVLTIQSCLDVTPLDGDFGSITHGSVVDFQRKHRLDADGIVGAKTWEELDEAYTLPPYPVPLLAPLPLEQKDGILAIAAGSKAATYAWRDRGLSPTGYVNGMALGFALMVRKHLMHQSVAIDMARANTGDRERDALAWYADVFAAQNMDNSRPGVGTLRHLWTLLWGLGMRESSGKYCCGRDMSATNVSADTAEAGLFQMSWNARSCSPHMQRLLDEYSQPGAAEQGGLAAFRESVRCSQSDLACYGSGAGVTYQKLAKAAPQFAAETAAVALRRLRQHFGPINRQEAQVRPEVDSLLMEVQEIVTSTGV